jgi:hypothetical protein
MCYNSTVSLIAFSSSMLFSILLILYGNPIFRSENLAFGTLLMFVAGIQFMEFLFWIDLHNKIGINKVATIIGSLFNIGQPLLIYIIKVLIFRPVFRFDYVTILNLVYMFYLLYVYSRFLHNGPLTTSTITNGHLHWPWLKYANREFFLLMFAINIFYLTDFSYSLAMFSIVYAILALVIVFFPRNAAEFWCFMSASVPAIMLPVSYLLSYNTINKSV